jgi:hypothetical protein
MSVRGDNSDAASTPDRPNVELLTQVEVPGSEEVVPEDDPSQMSPLIEGMKTFAMECVPSHAMRVDHVAYTGRMEGEKAVVQA